MRARREIGSFLLASLVALASPADEKKGMPREDVVDVPAIGEGLCVHNLFQSNMVLQRGKPVSLWGWADAGEKVTVTFGGNEQATTAADDRSWKVVLPAMAASSEPRTLTVRGREKMLTLGNVLVGDVWVLGGQSNMEFPIGKVENGPLEIVSANFPEIRILTVPALNGPEPRRGFPRLYEWSGWSGRHFRKGDWDICSPETVAELSAIGYVFARRIHMATRIPIGVIDASRGGTTVETWIPDSVLRKIDTEEVKALLAQWDRKVAEFDPKKDLEERVGKHEEWVERMNKEGKEIPSDRTTPTDLRPGPAADPNRPGNCYAAMITPLEGLAVKGAIWHQGYNNCFNGTTGAIMYGQAFPKMITAWREAFNDPEMPFGIISLCTQGETQTRDNFCSQMLDVGPHIREAQYSTFLDFYNGGDKNIGFTSTYDLRRRWYHPQLKIPAGERIARWALATQYGCEKEIRWKPPIVKEMKVEDGRILLYMDEAIAGVDDGGPMTGFAIAGENRHFHPADIDHLVRGRDDRGRPRKDSTVLVLSSPMVPKPIHYRYAWARNPMANIQIQGNTDIPMATQRSDDWMIEETPVKIATPKAMPEDAARRYIWSQIRKDLERDDLERRVREAEATLAELKPLLEKANADRVKRNAEAERGEGSSVRNETER